MADLGATIRRLRRASGLTQKELARRVEVTPSYLSRLEKNRKEPSLALLRQIGDNLEVPFGVLVASALLVEMPFDQRNVYGPIVERLIQLAELNEMTLGLEG